MIWNNQLKKPNMVDTSTSLWLSSSGEHTSSKSAKRFVDSEEGYHQGFAENTQITKVVALQTHIVAQKHNFSALLG